MDFLLNKEWNIWLQNNCKVDYYPSYSLICSRVYVSIPICPKQFAWNSPRVTRKWANPNHSPIQRQQPHILHWCTHSLDVSKECLKNQQKQKKKKIKKIYQNQNSKKMLSNQMLNANFYFCAFTFVYMYVCVYICSAFNYYCFLDLFCIICFLFYY